MRPAQLGTIDRISVPVTAALGAVILLVACGPAVPPPPAEFLLSAGDSTYWVRTDTTGIRVRGSPILLARYGGQFYEVYVTDDDRSFTDAMFVGQRIYRRDLVTGDSTLVFEDSLVPGMARSYAAANPSARRLGPDEEGADDPGASTTSEVTILDVHGPYLSYDYHVDVEGAGAPSWHATRRGVVDLRTGEPATLVRLFGSPTAVRLARQARLAYLAAIDSIFRSDSEGARLVAAALRSYAFDEASFAITDLAGRPAVAFHIPGKGAGTAGGVTLPLPPIAAGDVQWWRDDVRPGLPQVRADSLIERWSRGSLEVAARYDTAFGGAFATVALRDSARRREWPVARVQTPVHHIHWLDRPALDSVARHGLAKAFNEAAFYDENVRTAGGGKRGEGSGKREAVCNSWLRRGRRTPLAAAHTPWPNGRMRRGLPPPLPASRFPPPAAAHDSPHQDRPRVPARDLRADDAPERQQPGPRLRRRHPLDDGQGGGDRGLQALPTERRHRLDRPRGLP